MSVIILFCKLIDKNSRFKHKEKQTDIERKTDKKEEIKRMKRNTGKQIDKKIEIGQRFQLQKSDEKLKIKVVIFN